MRSFNGLYFFLSCNLIKEVILVKEKTSHTAAEAKGPAHPDGQQEAAAAAQESLLRERPRDGQLNRMHIRIIRKKRW